jgi:hypothetical protein
MSASEFGNSVDEVQRKLTEILPLVDSGVEQVMKLHEVFAEELPKYQTIFDDIKSGISEIGAIATKENSGLLDQKNTLASQNNELIDILEENNQKTGDAMSALTEVQERTEAEINATGTRVDAGATALKEQVRTVSQNADVAKESLNSLQEKATDAFAELTQGIDDFTSQWDDDESSSQQSLDNLKSAVSENHTAEVKKQFDGINNSTVETVSNVVSLFSDSETGFNNFFSAFDTDAVTLAAEFKSKSQEMFGNLKDYAEKECGQVLENALENLAGEIVEGFATEVITSIATAEFGATTTAALSPIIPELALAKKATGVINSIL